jgi:hypothetical protein
MGIGLECIVFCNASNEYIYNEEDESKTFRRPVASFTEGEMAHLVKWVVKGSAVVAEVPWEMEPRLYRTNFVNTQLKFLTHFLFCAHFFYPLFLCSMTNISDDAILELVFNPGIYSRVWIQPSICCKAN